MVANNKSQKEMNTLEQEILIQEQLMVANEINKLEHNITFGDSATFAQTKRIKTGAILFSSILIAVVALFLFIIFLVKDVINLSKNFQEILTYFDIAMIFILPLVSISTVLLANKISLNKKNDANRANVVMLRRLEKYYRFLKFDFDPEKYKVWNDDFVVDVDESGYLVKYVRFYNRDGTITTSPFRNIDELKKYIEQSEDTIRLKEINDKMNETIFAIDQNENQYAKFNQFQGITNGVVSKAVVERETINDIVFTDPTIDYWPEQYAKKLSKWYSREEYLDGFNFVNRLKSNLLTDSWSNGNKVVVDTEWIMKDFHKAQAAFNNNLFKQYDITKTKSQADDIESYILMIKNLDMKKDPALNWEETIDPKDINQEKLISYNQKIKELEERALELSKMQKEQEYLIKHGSNNTVIKVELLDSEEQYRNIFDNYHPYEGIEQEIKNQRERNKIIKKSKGFIIENDLTDFNFDDLSNKQLKQIIKQKEKESEEVENIRFMEANDDLVKLKNEIARVKASKFTEKHLAFEKYQNEEFRWMYHDGEGKYYEANDNMEWIEVDPPSIAFNEKKLETIKNLQKQYNALQKEKEANFNDKYSSIVKIKEKALLEEQAREKQELDKENAELEKQELAKQKAKDKKTKKKATKEKKAKQTTKDTSTPTNTNSYVETHPANETWLAEDNKYYYHDGEGNYFTTNENNEWVACNPPTHLANTQAPANTSKAHEPYQDEQGVWWYIDEQGNYFYGDEQGQWVQYKGEQ